MKRIVTITSVILIALAVAMIVSRTTRVHASCGVNHPRWTKLTGGCGGGINPHCDNKD